MTISDFLTDYLPCYGFDHDRFFSLVKELAEIDGTRLSDALGKVCYGGRYTIG